MSHKDSYIYCLFSLPFFTKGFLESADRINVEKNAFREADAVQKLIENLELQKTALNELAALLLQEREAIMNNESTLLTHLLQQKADCQAALAALEQKRIVLSGEKTLSQLTVNADETAKSLLSSLAEELKKKLRELRSINDTNLLLLKHNLAYFRHLRQIFTPEQGITPYNKTGTLNERSNHLLLSKLA